MKWQLVQIVIFGLSGFFLKENLVETVNYAQLQNMVEKKSNDTLYIVNFWATWCKPCVAEMPFFMEADNKYKAQKVKVIFVSLNSMKELPKVQVHVDKNNIQNPVYVLDAGNPNNWIDKIDNSWSGSIPATVLYKNGRKMFFKEGDFTQDELEKTILKYNNP